MGGGAHGRFGSEMERPGLSRSRQDLVYSLWHCLEMIPCLCGAIRALSPETRLPGSRPTPGRGAATNSQRFVTNRCDFQTWVQMAPGGVQQACTDTFGMMLLGT